MRGMRCLKLWRIREPSQRLIRLSQASFNIQTSLLPFGGLSPAILTARQDTPSDSTHRGCPSEPRRLPALRLRGADFAAPCRFSKRSPSPACPTSAGVCFPSGCAVAMNVRMVLHLHSLPSGIAFASVPHTNLEEIFALNYRRGKLSNCRLPAPTCANR